MIWWFDLPMQLEFKNQLLKMWGYHSDSPMSLELKINNWGCKDAAAVIWSINMMRDFGVCKLATAFKNNTAKLIDKYSKINFFKKFLKKIE